MLKVMCFHPIYAYTTIKPLFMLNYKITKKKKHFTIQIFNLLLKKNNNNKLPYDFKTCCTTEQTLNSNIKSIKVFILFLFN